MWAQYLSIPKISVGPSVAKLSWILVVLSFFFILILCIMLPFPHPLVGSPFKCMTDFHSTGRICEAAPTFFVLGCNTFLL